MYLKDDVLLLIPLFETFRKKSINSFELDPTYYLSTPSYAWDAMLRFTDVTLKLISDVEKYQFIESTIRGGISMIYKGYAEAYNKLLKSYDANKPTSYRIYLETNNLYGHSTMQLSPTKIFNPKDFSLGNYPNDSLVGYFLEVDLDCLDELHDLDNDYPLAGGKIEVKKEMLSKYKLQIIEDNNFSLGKNKKLFPNLRIKRKYKLHYQNLKLYFRLGLSYIKHKFTKRSRKRR